MLEASGFLNCVFQPEYGLFHWAVNSASKWLPFLLDTKPQKILHFPNKNNPPPPRHNPEEQKNGGEGKEISTWLKFFTLAQLGKTLEREDKSSLV